MRNNIFIARLTRGAVVSAMATCMPPLNHTAPAIKPMVGHEAATNNRTTMAEEGTQRGPGKTVVMTLGQAPMEWDKKMEREFRKLALEEAKGSINATQAARLEELEMWRNRLLKSQSPEDILVQLKRDRLLEKMESILREYVQFQEATNQKRAAA